MNRPPAWLIIFTWIATILWAGTIHWFSARPGPEIEQMNVFELWDKGLHFIAFAAGAPFVFCALKWTFGWPIRTAAAVAIAAVALYGAVDEYHQKFTPNRQGADVYDWTADALGGAAGVLAAAFLYAQFTRPPRGTAA